MASVRRWFILDNEKYKNRLHKKKEGKTCNELDLRNKIIRPHSIDFRYYTGYSINFNNELGF